MEKTLDRSFFKILAFLGIVFLLFKLGVYFLQPFMIRMLSVSEVEHLSLTSRGLATLQGFLLIGFNLVVGGVLFFRARKHFPKTGVIWFALGAFFGLEALILFVLLIIYQNVRRTNSVSGETVRENGLLDR